MTMREPQGDLPKIEYYTCPTCSSELAVCPICVLPQQYVFIASDTGDGGSNPNNPFELKRYRTCISCHNGYLNARKKEPRLGFGVWIERFRSEAGHD